MNLHESQKAEKDLRKPVFPNQFEAMKISNFQKWIVVIACGAVLLLVCVAIGLIPEWRIV